MSNIALLASELLSEEQTDTLHAHFSHGIIPRIEPEKARHKGRTQKTFSEVVNLDRGGKVPERRRSCIAIVKRS
jgi:hypothetical protein